MAGERLEVTEAALAALQQEEGVRRGGASDDEVELLKAEVGRLGDEKLKAESALAELTDALEGSDRDREKLRQQLQRLKEQMINEQVWI